jgi:phage baseplate assembly protein W
MANPIKSYSAIANGKRWIFDGAFQFDFDAPANSVQEVLQNVFNIIATPLGTQPLFRLFGSDQNWIDSPGNLIGFQAKTAFLLAIRLWEPRANIQQIQFALNPLDVMAGQYTLSLVVEVDLSRSITQALYAPPSDAATWLIDGPVDGVLSVQQETVTV